MAPFEQEDNEVMFNWYEQYGYNEMKTSQHFGRSGENSREFWIEGQLDRSKTFTVNVYKTNPKRAKAIIEVTINNLPMQRTEVKKWTRNCEFRFLNIPSMRTRISSRRFDVEIRCKIIWQDFVPDVTQPAFNLYDWSKKYFMSPELSDVIITIESYEIRAHRTVLAFQSPVFSQLLQSNTSESRDHHIVIKDVNINAMMKVLRFLYCGDLPEDTDLFELGDIVNVAEKYGIENLKEFCAFLFSTKMTHDNVLMIYEQAAMYNMPKVLSDAKEMMLSDVDFITARTNFFFMCKKFPVLLRHLVVKIINFVDQKTRHA